MRHHRQLQEYVIVLAVLLVVALLLSGCKLPPLETSDRHLIAAENWELCQSAHKLMGSPIYSTHAHHRGRKHRYTEVRQDLWDNSCKQVLGKYWIEYD